METNKKNIREAELGYSRKSQPTFVTREWMIQAKGKTSRENGQKKDTGEAGWQAGAVISFGSNDQEFHFRSYNLDTLYFFGCIMINDEEQFCILQSSPFYTVIFVITLVYTYRKIV